ncbi:MAG: type II secretion system F family protein [Nanoarchaeota archaeon]|nr:type II secretion system F family protein [Nanoarchaeota archaeon]MBU1028084.1 type II secretion system F family protein [Nanoarchaeota archaeon]
MISKKDFVKELKNNISKEKTIIRELKSLFISLDKEDNLAEKKMLDSQINSLKDSLKTISKNIMINLERINLSKPLLQIKETPNVKRISVPIKKTFIPTEKPKINMGISKLEEETLKRFRKKKEKEKKRKREKPSRYLQLANKTFSGLATSLIKKTSFRTLGRDLIKSKIQTTPITYISIILLTTLFSVLGGIVIFLFFLFFNIGSSFPIITSVTENLGTRFVKVFWILFIVPIATFLIMYFYPSLEKKTAEIKINRELPFATIHMAAISGSLIEPGKIFSIIISTKEYPAIEKEFIKIINETNVYGYNLATSLRNVAFNSPSKKLADLLNGVATTINSGGDLPEFFDKRSQTLLFEHRIDKEKQTKAAETFMDIYISVVIAAPMILMLLLMMMSISGLSWITPSMITLIMILGVSLANIIFLGFLHLKGSTE